MTITLNGTTGITLPNGSASAPAATGSDTDTGIVYGTNTVSLATGGTTAVTVDSSQNVGINTSSPNAKLDVTGQILTGSTGNNAVAINSSGSNYGFISNPSSGVFALGYGTTIGTLGTSVATWNSSGNFGFNSGYGSVATAYGCRAWVDFNGTGTPAIRASGNVSSITDTATGSFVVNLTTAMPDTNYAAVSDSNNGTSASASSAMRSSSARPLTTSTVGFYAFPNDASGTLADSDYNHLSVYR